MAVDARDRATGIGRAESMVRRLGLRRIPGDITIELAGKQFSFPIGSTVMLSLLASLIFWMLR
jgi:hypothetical protein